MQAEKNELSENSSIGMRLSIAPHSDGIPGLDGRWHWELVAESSGKLYVHVEGQVAECKTLRLQSVLSAEEAKRLSIWLTSRIPSMSSGKNQPAR